jgi:hypothetical protein
MSWYVRYLISNRDLINCKEDIEDQELNDLLVVEKKLEKLIEDKQVTDAQLESLLYFSNGITRIDQVQETAKKNFRSLCDRVAYSLGGYFTDEGLIIRLTREHGLSPSQVQQLSTRLKENKWICLNH